MTSEHVKTNIGNALDLLQIITEDLEENFFGTGLGNAMEARASMTVSALYILGDYLRNIQKEAKP